MAFECKLDFEDVAPCVHASMMSALNEIVRRRSSRLQIRDFFYIDCSSDEVYRGFAYSYFSDGFGIESCMYFDIYMQFNFRDRSFEWRADSKCLSSKKL